MDGGGEGVFSSPLPPHPPLSISEPASGNVIPLNSGTTGPPKGYRPRPPPGPGPQAGLPLMGLAVNGAGIPADGSMVYLSPAPLYHAAPIGWCSTVHRLGGTIVMMEKFDPEAALQAIEKYRVTDSQWVQIGRAHV